MVTPPYLESALYSALPPLSLFTLYRMSHADHVTPSDCSAKVPHWMKICVTLEVEGARQRGKPRKTWKEVVEWCSATWIVVKEGSD